MDSQTNSSPSSVSWSSHVIPDRLFFRIGDVAELLEVKPYVLRYWETEFKVISPDKSKTGQRVYRRSDVENLMLIKHLLYQERYSIEGARKRINELRKEGALKSFKEEKVIHTAENSERMKQARIAVREMKKLIERPIEEIFRV